LPHGRLFSRIISPPYGRGRVEEGLPEEDEGKEKLQDPDRWNSLSLPGRAVEELRDAEGAKKLRG